jgi:cysteine desulfurase
VRRRPRVRLVPLFSGGGQERGLRSGTLPAPLVIGLGEACRLAQAEMADEATRIADAAHPLAGSPARRAARGAGQRQTMDGAHRRQPEPDVPGGDRGRADGAVPDLCVSTGSACSSAEVEPSYVLRALGLPPDEAARTLRIGIGRFTSPPTSTLPPPRWRPRMRGPHARGHPGLNEGLTA